MKWEEFAHAVRAAASVLGEDEVVVLGSQAILAYFTELPEEAVQSRAVDIAALDDPDEAKSHVLAGAIGEDSPFDRMFGYHVDGVSLSTPIAPSDWLERCERVSTPAMNGVTAICMEPHDLCAAKLLTGRDNDRRFVTALLRARLVDPQRIDSLLGQVATDSALVAAARASLAAIVADAN